MSKKRKRKKSIKIKEALPSIVIDKNDIIQNDYPTFCFKYLSDISIKDCKNSDFFVEFLMRLRKLSELGWKEIKVSGRHSYGMEKISINDIHPQLPSCITPEVKHLHVFRATGKKLPFVGLEMQNVFRVLYIETKFGDIYTH